MIFWIKQEKEGKIVRLEDNSWSHSIYVSSDNKHDLASIAKDKRISSFIKRYEFVKKYEKIIDKTKSEVLKLTLTDRSEEHTSELQSRQYLVCRLLLEKKQELPELARRLLPCVVSRRAILPGNQITSSHSRLDDRPSARPARSSYWTSNSEPRPADRLR